jgi:hypothetical protein
MTKEGDEDGGRRWLPSVIDGNSSVCIFMAPPDVCPGDIAKEGLTRLSKAIEGSSREVADSLREVADSFREVADSFREVADSFRESSRNIRDGLATAGISVSLAQVCKAVLEYKVGVLLFSSPCC